MVWSPALADSVRVNTPGNARLTFEHMVDDELRTIVDSNFKLGKQVADDDAFRRALLDWLFERYRKRVAA